MGLIGTGHQNWGDHLFVREISHRIANEFASAIGAVSLAAARSHDREVKEALAGVVKRLHNYARVHRALQIPSPTGVMDAAEHVRSLCQAISRARLQDRSIELKFVQNPVLLNSDQCWKLGMIISELITNAARHAFGAKGGSIWIELRSTREFVECRVVDDGVCRGDAKPGEGTKIIQALVRELDGEFTQQFSSKGAMSILIFPE